MLLKTVAIVLSVFVIVVLMVIALSNPSAIQLNFTPPHTTEKSSSEEMVIDPETVFVLAAMFLVGAIVLGILLIVVALKMPPT